MITEALIVLGIVSAAAGKENLRAEPCDTSSEHLNSLVRDVQNLQVDSFFVASRAQWGWSSSPAPVVPVEDPRLCRRAAATLIQDRWTEAHAGVALVRVGKSYVAQPSSRGDAWIVLDSTFKILSRIVVPS
jgi:hypothetical protein